MEGGWIEKTPTFGRRLRTSKLVSREGLKADRETNNLSGTLYPMTWGHQRPFWKQNGKHHDVEGFRHHMKSNRGSAGSKNHWHHIVEQCQIQLSGFSNSWVHSTWSVISFDVSRNVAFDMNENESDDMLSQTDVLINVRDTPRWAGNAIYREHKCDVQATTEITKCTYAIYNSYYAIEVSTTNADNCDELFRLEFQRMLQAVAKAQGE